MFVKTKERSGRKLFYLCIAEQGGDSGRSWKTVEYSVCLGETLDLGSTQWLEILRASSEFRSIPLDEVLNVVERYVAAHCLPAGILDGLRGAVLGGKRHSHRAGHGDRRELEDERAMALRLLGLRPDSSEGEIESAFRKAARRYHPDVGGDPKKFQEIVEARNLLLGRDPGLRGIV